LCGIAAYYHVAADPVHLSRELPCRTGRPTRTISSASRC
jgi:hypothetical protein